MAEEEINSRILCTKCEHETVGTEPANFCENCGAQMRHTTSWETIVPCPS